MIRGLLALGLVLFAVSGGSTPEPRAEHGKGFASITAKDVEAHLREVASAPLEGRDTPSVGLVRAGDYIIDRFSEAGLEGAGPNGGFRIAWSRSLPAPKTSGCRLILTPEDGEKIEFVLTEDYVPLPNSNGKGAGRPVFCGFGISSKKEKYNDLKKADLDGNVAVILDGEPRHKRKFDGEIVSPDADIHVKLKNLAEAGAVAVVIVRRPPADQPKDMDPAGIGFRHTWASWMPSSGQRDPRIKRETSLAVVEVTPETADRILGGDVLATAEKMDRRAKARLGRAPRRDPVGRIGDRDAGRSGRQHRWDYQGYRSRPRPRVCGCGRPLRSRRRGRARAGWVRRG